MNFPSSSRKRSKTMIWLGISADESKSNYILLRRSRWRRKNYYFRALSIYLWGKAWFATPSAHFPHFLPLLKHTPTIRLSLDVMAWVWANIAILITKERGVCCYRNHCTSASASTFHFNARLQENTQHVSCYRYIFDFLSIRTNIVFI